MCAGSRRAARVHTKRLPTRKMATLRNLKRCAKPGGWVERPLGGRFKIGSGWWAWVNRTRTRACSSPGTDFSCRGGPQAFVSRTAPVGVSIRTLCVRQGPDSPGMTLSPPSAASSTCTARGPTADSWAAARASPCAKTTRNRLGSFCEAILRSGVTSLPRGPPSDYGADLPTSSTTSLQPSGAGRKAKASSSRLTTSENSPWPMPTKMTQPLWERPVSAHVRAIRAKSRALKVTITRPSVLARSRRRSSVQPSSARSSSTDRTSCPRLRRASAMRRAEI